MARSAQTVNAGIELERLGAQVDQAARSQADGERADEERGGGGEGTAAAGT